MSSVYNFKIFIQMNIELMLDTIKIITEKSQSAIQQAVRKDKPIRQKLKIVSLYLGQLKSQIFEWIANLLNSAKDIQYLAKKLDQLKAQNDQQVAKHRLHILLKKKLNKLKKQSFLHSMDSTQNFFNEESKMIELQKSVILIEKDLKIENEEEQNLGISSIIQRSRMFDQSLGKDQHNHSTVSQYEAFKLDLTEKKTNEERNNQRLTSVFSINSKNFTHFNVCKAQLGANSQIFANQEMMKQNQQRNIPKLASSQLQEKVPNQMPNQKVQLNTSNIKVDQPPKIMKKKKKSIYSSLGPNGNLSKQDLLGNILEECLENENK